MNTTANPNQGPSTLYEHWSMVCYIPHNDAFGIALEASAQGEAYNRQTMAEIHEGRIAEGVARARATLAEGNIEPDQAALMLQVFEWVKTATRVLLDHVAQLGAVGDLPPCPVKGMRDLTEYETTTIGEMAIRIASLPGTPFMGWQVPKLEARFSKHHEQGMVTDIVPVDPRFGGNLPDWGVPDSAERMHMPDGF